MEIYNSDGSQAEMCGNGIRCFSKYVYEKGLTKNKTLTIETLAGIKKVNLEVKNNLVNLVSVNMGTPNFILEKIPVNLPDANSKMKIGFNLNGIYINGYAVSFGNPHFVIFTKNVENIDINTYGPLIENYHIFPKKTNVEFIEVQGNTSIKMRVWERGSGETFACGTGACASFSVCNMLGFVKDFASVYLKGGELKLERNCSTNEIKMTGPATYVYDGFINIDFNNF